MHYYDRLRSGDRVMNGLLASTGIGNRMIIRKMLLEKMELTAINKVHSMVSMN